MSNNRSGGQAKQKTFKPKRVRLALHVLFIVFQVDLTLSTWNRTCQRARSRYASLCALGLRIPTLTRGSLLGQAQLKKWA